jgi:hypothetical protein
LALAPTTVWWRSSRDRLIAEDSISSVSSNAWDQQIAQSIEESCKATHTEAGHLGILLWEIDWRPEPDCLLADFANAEDGRLMQPQSHRFA